MLALQFIQPGQQDIAPEVRRRRQLQHATDVILPPCQLTPPFIQAGQGIARVQQKALAFGGQAQVAGRAGQQARTQLLLQAFECSTGHRRGKVEQACRRRQAAQFGGANEQLQVIDSHRNASALSKKH
ncbi:hypothetical protein D3C75_898640 [compost metagenome]